MSDAGDEKRNGQGAPSGAGVPASSAIVPVKGQLAPYDTPRDRRTAVFGGAADAAIPLGMASSEQVESFRELRTRLMLTAAGAGLTHFSTVVVPLTEDAGGSFVARNLAAAFTLQQRHALLIDCNFRNAAQQEALAPDLELEGLFEFLDRGRAGLAPEGLPMWPTAIPGLHLIPAGRYQSALAGAHREYLASPSMKHLMATLRDWPCYVVLDAPPASGSPDARLLSELADLVVLVVRYGRSTHQDIERAAAVFDRKKFAGIAFNEYAGASREKRAR